MEELISKLKSKDDVEGGLIRNLNSIRHNRSGWAQERHSVGGVDLAGAFVLVKYQRLVDIGMGICMILHQLSPLELLQLFTEG